MRGLNKCGVPGPTSDTLGTFDQLKAVPDQQNLYTVTVDQNKRVKVIWPRTYEKDFARYFLYKGSRIQNVESFTMLYATNSVSDTVFMDEEVNVQDESYCYYLMMKDTCDNYSPLGKKACSIVLKGTSYPFEHVLDWQPFNYWDAGTAEYRLHRRDTEKPDAVTGTTDPAVNTWVDNKLNRKSGLYWYQVVAAEKGFTDASNTVPAESRSNEIELIQAPLLHVPNAFTANSDAINDVWGIRDVFVKDYHLRVYNAWGQLVFETTDKNVQWDGYAADATIQQTGVYVYLVTYTGWDESSHTRKGNVTVLR
jgi:gliding motility-associated-like protein